VRSGLLRLRQRLAERWSALLFRHCIDLCEPAGVRFLGFNVDPDFADATGGLIRLDLEFLKPAKRERCLDVAAARQLEEFSSGAQQTLANCHRLLLNSS
jgi:hypothetical protein